MLGMVAHTYNSSYLGGRGRRTVGLRPLGTKELGDPIPKNKLGVLVKNCSDSYEGGVGRKISLRLAQAKKYETLSEK
jgi:hypothetical protein